MLIVHTDIKSNTNAIKLCVWETYNRGFMLCLYIVAQMIQWVLINIVDGWGIKIYTHKADRQIKKYRMEFYFTWRYYSLTFNISFVSITILYKTLSGRKCR